MKGSYLLVLRLDRDNNIPVGKKNIFFFEKGFYIYVGSALNGLENRINRHLRKNKKIYWHIDYFLKTCEIEYVFYKENNHKEECLIAQYFNNKFKSIKNFGCSDCDCKSHLFYGNINEILKIAYKLDFSIYYNAKI